MSFKLKVTSRTWSKDNYNLFDYDLVKELNHQEFTLKSDGLITRRQGETRYISSNPKKSFRSTNPLDQVTLEDKQLFSIRCSEQELKIIPPIEKGQSLWKVVPRSETGCIQVKVNDVIKVGKKQLKILQICNGGDNFQKIMGLEDHYNISNIRNTFISEMGSIKSGQSKISNRSFMIEGQEEIDTKREERLPCRICLSSSSSRKNPLLALCQCKGSARWIHFECLHTWINKKLVISEKPHFASIKSKSIKCELCTSLIPSEVILGDEVYELYRFSTIKFDKYAVIEDADGLISMLNFTQKSEFDVGRGHNRDIKLNEITVSRKHMRLFLNNIGQLYVSDFGSKFGTLIQVTKPLQLQNHETIDLQSGRTHLKLRRILQKSKIRRFFSSLLCCSKQNDREEDHASEHNTRRIMNDQMRRDILNERLQEDLNQENNIIRNNQDNSEDELNLVSESLSLLQGIQQNEEFINQVEDEGQPSPSQPQVMTGRVESDRYVPLPLNGDQSQLSSVPNYNENFESTYEQDVPFQTNATSYQNRVPDSLNE